ncbi:PAS domain S-box protein [Thioalkalivibrio sp.]|uniref:PAS domain S-box protein n=1 Tax=Thioalkalivibrio sp. TaxID=2093813 RepID=UPI003562B834
MNDRSTDELAVLKRELQALQAKLDACEFRERRSRNVLHSMIEGFGLAEILLDGQGQPYDYRLLEVNEAYGQLTGFPPEVANGKTARELTPGVEPRWIETFAQVALTGESARFDARSADLTRWFEVVAYRTAPGQLAHLLIDITARKRVEQAAEQRERELKEAQRLAHVGSWEWTAATDTVTWSEQMYRIAGRDPSSPAPDYFREHRHIYTHDSIARLNAAVQEALRSAIPYELDLELIRPDGTTRTVLARGEVRRDSTGNIVGLRGTVQDITERKRMEEALRESEARYRRQAAELEQIYRTAPVGRGVLDTELRYVRVNERLAEFNGIPIEAHPGKTLREVAPRVADRIEPLLRQVLENGSPILDVEFSAEVPSEPGVRRYWVDHFWPLKSDDSAVVGINIVAEEITERKRLEEAHRRDMEFRTLADHTPDNVARYDRDLRYLYVNPALAANAGISREAFLGKTDQELGIPEPFATDWARRTRRVFDTGREEEIAFDFPTPQGARYFESRLVPESGPEGRVETVLAVTRDLTERKRAEEAIERTAYALGERNKELRCLYAVASLTQQRARPLAEMLLGIVDALVPAYQYPEITCARISIEGASYHTEPFAQTPWRQTEAIAVDGQNVGLIEVFYREERPPVAEGPFLTEERELLRAVAEMLGRALLERRQWAARLQAEVALQQAQRLAHVGSWEWDRIHDLSHWSDEMFRIAGRAPQTFTVTLQSALEVVHPEDRERVRTLAQGAIETGEGFVDEHRIVQPDGSERVVTSRAEAVKGAGGEVVALRGTWLDITERKRMEEALRESEARFRKVVELVPDILYRMVLPGYRAEFVSPAVKNLLGFEPEQWQRDPTIWVRQLHEDDRDQVLAGLDVALRDAQRCTQQYRMWHSDGRTLRWFEDRKRIERDTEGKPVAVFGVMNDITSLKRAQQALEHETQHDPLTGVANRRFLRQFIEREWRRETRHGHTVSCIMVDIDHFKAYNDHYGHQQGDKCLRKVAQALRSHLRRSTDLLVRYGGEEFLVVLLETELEPALQLAETMRRGIEDLALPHITSPISAAVTISVGVAAKPARRSTFQALVEAADEAVYRAKARGRNRVEVEAANT